MGGLHSPKVAVLLRAELRLARFSAGLCEAWVAAQPKSGCATGVVANIAPRYRVAGGRRLHPRFFVPWVSF